MSEFSKRLNQAMNLRGMRQIDLANKTGIDRAMIHGYVRGKNIPQDDRLRLLADALNCDVLWLAGYDGIEEDDEKEFLEVFRSLNKKDREAAQSYLLYLRYREKKGEAEE